MMKYIRKLESGLESRLGHNFDSKEWWPVLGFFIVGYNAFKDRPGVVSHSLETGGDRLPLFICAVNQVVYYGPPGVALMVYLSNKS